MKISIIGSVIEIGAILAWFITYQAKWKSWGAAGDNLNVIAYRGE